MGGRSEEKVAREDFYDVKVAIFVSFLAWPVAYFFNNGFEQIHEDDQALVMMVAGFVLLACIIGTVAKISRINDWMGYVMTVFAFTSMIDHIISWEYRGYIKGFMSQYLSLGEPYLHSQYGNAICLFDGVGLYLLYLVMIHRISNRKSWSSIGIYWGSALFNSLIVLLVGVLAGKHAPTFCTFLNVPYAIFPILAIYRACNKDDRGDWKGPRGSFMLSKMLDLVGVISSLTLIWIILAKGLISLGSEFKLLQQFLQHEPADLFDDPAPFAKIQNLLFFFYLLPIQVIFLCYSFKSRKPEFLWKIGLVQAGIVLQGQCSFIIMALDSRTPNKYRSNVSDEMFWLYNLILLLVPHMQLGILAYQYSAEKILKKKSK